MLIEIAGWIGAVLILLAYLMAARGVWPAASLRSAAINTIGSAGILANAAVNSAWPSVGLNAAWIVIAVRAGWRHRPSADPA